MKKLGIQYKELGITSEDLLKQENKVYSLVIYFARIVELNFIIVLLIILHQTKIFIDVQTIKTILPNLVEKLENSLEEQRKEDISNKKLLSQYEKRVKDIDNLIQHIYEDNISGKITDDRFATLSLNYEREQKGLKEKITQLANTIDKTNQEELDLTTFIDKVKKYTEIKELTPEIVNELIDKIYVYQQTKLNGKKYQEIDIHYAGVGIIAIPLNEYELENAFQQSIKNTKTA